MSRDLDVNQVLPTGRRNSGSFESAFSPACRGLRTTEICQHEVQIECREITALDRFLFELNLRLTACAPWEASTLGSSTQTTP
jgi:hypothetical protein